MELCSLRTMCLEWSATDFAFVIHHTRTVPKQTKDNTILLGLRDVTLALSWLFWLLELAPYKCSTYLLTYHPAVAWRWFGGDTRSRLRDVACRLLQCNPRCGSEDNNRQATTSVERCCTSRQRHQEVWSGTITTDAPGVTLAGHSRASKLQAGSADPPVSARQSASVPIKLLHSSQSSSFAAASTLRCTSSTDRTSTSSQHLRSAGICCRWSDDV